MKKVKNFKLLSTSKKVVEFKKIKSKYIILYFYPKDDTPGCTLETRDFNSYYNKVKQWIKHSWPKSSRPMINNRIKAGPIKYTQLSSIYILVSNFK